MRKANFCSYSKKIFAYFPLRAAAISAQVPELAEGLGRAIF